jgi:tetratricopeptide (TPR) repeat protein
VGVPSLVAQDASLTGIEALIRQGKLDDAGTQLQAMLQKQPSNARALTLLGSLRRQQGNWPEAEALYRRAVVASPASLDACQELAALLREEARWPEAVKQYESCHKLAPANLKVAADLARVYEKNGDYTKSLAVTAAIPIASRPTKLLPVIASDYVATHNSQKTVEALADVLRHAADDPAIVPALANTLLDHGMVGDAAELLRVAQSHQKVTSAFLATQAKVQAATGETQQAGKTVDQAVGLDPKSQEVLAAGAVLAIRWEQWDKALEFLDAALAAGPPRSDLLQSLVFAELRKNNLQAAHDVAQRWYELRPDETAGALAFAVVLVEGNHWGEARPLLEKVLAKAPNDKGAQLAMGVVQYNAGDPATAKKYLTAALGGGPDDANAHYFLGLIAKQEGDFPGAVSQMEQSVAIRSNNPKAYGQLGQLYLQQDDLSEARAALEKATQQAPDEPQNHYELARVYNKLGLKDLADEQLKLYQKLRPQRPVSPAGEAPTQPR